MSNSIRPQRIQRKRVKGFDLQAVSLALNGLPAMSVTRGGRYGNPFKIGDTVIFGHEEPKSVKVTKDNCLFLFEERLRWELKQNPAYLDALRGHNLACWCPLSSPCHVDIYLKILAETE